MSLTHDARVYEILTEVRPLAAEFYRLTGKPLGVTGEIAEYIVAQELDLELAEARNPGYDAIRRSTGERIQIKGRAYDADAKTGQRLSRIKIDAPCDTVIFVRLDPEKLIACEMWEAPFSAVVNRLAIGGSKSRDRGMLGVSEFKRIATKIWPRGDVSSK
jgi:hypothetical protein